MIYLSPEKISLPQNPQRISSQPRRSAVNMSTGADCFVSSKTSFNGKAPEAPKAGSFVEVLFGNVGKMFKKSNRERYSQYNACLDGTPFKY